MSHLGVPPRVVMWVAVGLIVLSIVLAASGTLAPVRAGVGDALLGLVALLNWNRHVKTGRDEQSHR